jgi:hypothetical protein
MIDRFRTLYGSNPLHVVAHLIAFAVAAWALDQIFGGGDVINYAAWFVGAALLHDLVLLPLYSVLNRVLHLAGAAEPSAPHRRPLLNYVRVPSIIAGVLLLVYFPLILGLSSRNYLRDTGHPLHGYTRNWLLITAGLFLASGIVYVLRNRPAPRPPAPRAAPAPAPPRERPEP